MTHEIKFPPEAEKIYREAQAYRRLSLTDRLLALLDLIASGMAILEQSPQREAAEALREAQEAEWRRIQKELFARHGSSTSIPFAASAPPS
jgi:hypothetical protein